MYNGHNTYQKKRRDRNAKKLFLNLKDYRDYALFVSGINTVLRISDLLQLKWEDIYNFQNESFQEHICQRAKNRKNHLYRT